MTADLPADPPPEGEPLAEGDYTASPEGAGDSPQGVAPQTPPRDPAEYFRARYRSMGTVPSHRYVLDITAYRQAFGSDQPPTDEDLRAAAQQVRQELREGAEDEESEDDPETGQPKKKKAGLGKKIAIGGAITTAVGIIGRAIYFLEQGRTPEEIKPFITQIVALAAVVIALGVTYFVVNNVEFPKKKKIRYTEVVVIIGLVVIGGGAFWIVALFVRDALFPTKKEPETIYVEKPPPPKPEVAPKDVIPFAPAYGYKSEEKLPVAIFGPPNDTDLRAREWMRDIELSARDSLSEKSPVNIWLLTTESANTKYTAHVYTGTEDSVVILAFLVEESDTREGYRASFVPLRKQVSDNKSWYLFEVPKCDYPSRLLVYTAMKQDTWRRFKDENQEFLIRSRAP